MTNKEKSIEELKSMSKQELEEYFRYIENEKEAN